MFNRRAPCPGRRAGRRTGRRTGAIADAKQTVRGAEKWYVDFDKCVPYFTKTYGCGLCLEVCPWADRERAGWLSDKLLAKRQGAGVAA